MNFRGLHGIAMVILLSGCSPALRTEYGESRGLVGDQSINGLGGLRRSYEKQGWSTLEINRLNSRLDNVDAIFWTPRTRDVIYNDATQWFDKWLADKTRTLVYVVPDDGCELGYFESALELADPEHRLAYRRRIARLETDQIIQRLKDAAPQTNAWFGVERLSLGTTVEIDSGEWQINTDKFAAGVTRKPLPVEFKIVPLPAVANSTSTSTSSPSGSSNFGSQVASSVDVKHATLLAASDGSPIIARITADIWGDSKIIVVGGGSLLCNYSLTTLLGREIAARLIAETADSPGAIGFMLTDARGAQVSEIDPEINAVSGMELLTVWPLNLIVLHLAVMGFVACMILWPIFGRPREIEEASSSDFADHLDAVAALMNKSGGEDYARRRVSDYMRRIRGETFGRWVMPEAKTAETAPHMLLTELNLPSVPSSNVEPAQSPLKEQP